MLDHFLSRAIERRIGRWVAAGQRSEPIPSADGSGYSLTFGLRYRLRIVAVSLLLGFFSLLVAWCHFSVEALDAWFILLYVGILLPAFLLSATLALAAHTTSIIVSADRIAIRRLGFDSAPVDWSDVASAYRSPVTPSIVLVLKNGRRVRLSTELDGLGALAAAFAQLAPGTADRSLIHWMMTMP